jgi:hypothetical protein
METSPLLFPLVGLLKTRGAKITLSCQLEKQVAYISRSRTARMKELSITVPLLASHRIHLDRRIVVGIGSGLEAWRDKMRYRGIELLSVSPDGLSANADGIADKVCAHIFRVSVEDLREMIQSGMPLPAISAFTGLPSREISQMAPRFYGMTVQELREQGT